MNDDIVQRVESHPDYIKLKSARTRFTWIYVRRANSEFDALTESGTRSVLK